MNIAFEIASQSVLFKEVDIGSTFMVDDTFYIKTESIYNASWLEKNAVDIRTGRLCCFAKDEQVEEVDAYILVKGKEDNYD